MKVKALAILSTAQGRREVGEEFSVTAAYAEELIARGLVQRAEAEPSAEPKPAPKVPKPPKAPKAKA